MSVPICAVILVLNDEGMVLVSSRRYSQTQLNLPGGKADPEDGDQAHDLRRTMLRCAARELREETSLLVEVEDLELIHCGICVDQVGREPNAINFTFFARKVGGTPLAPEGEPPIKWVSWQDLVEHTPYRAYNRALGLLLPAVATQGVS